MSGKQHQQLAPPHDNQALRALYRVRYLLATPFQMRIVPSFVPVIHAPYLKELPYITVGQIFLIVPWFILFLAGYHKTFNSPELDGSGEIASYAIVAAFLTANKANSVFSFLFGLSFERIVPIHNLYACLSVILSVFHGFVAFKYGGSGDSGDGMGDSGSGSSDRRERRLSGDDSEYALYGLNTNLWKFLWDGDSNFTGSMCTACMVGLVLLSFFRIIRKYLFEPWLFSHIIFSVGVIAFGIMHEVPLLILPFVWWMVDYVLRYCLQACGRFPKSAILTKLSDDLVEVRFKRTFSYEVGQFVQISIPALGPLQFHPITISSAPFEKEVTLHIRALGGWSKALVALAERTKETNMLVEGPYGALSVDIDNDKKYPVVLCISGGIGVTPCQSVARQLLHEAKHGRDLTHLRFAWVIRSVDMMDALPTVARGDLITGIDDTENNSVVTSDGEVPSSAPPKTSLRFQPEVYVTRAKKEDLVGRNHALQGRPDIPQIIKETMAVAKANGVTSVAVITCGPERMVDQVKATCRSLTGICGDVSLDVHDEIFDF